MMDMVFKRSSSHVLGKHRGPSNRLGGALLAMLPRFVACSSPASPQRQMKLTTTPPTGSSTGNETAIGGVSGVGANGGGGSGPVSPVHPAAELQEQQQLVSAHP